MAQKPHTNSGDAKLVKELAAILNETELAEIELKKGDLKIRVSKHAAPAVMQATQAAPMPMAAAPVAPAPNPAPETPTPEKKSDAASHPGAVKSPMVGTAYIRPSPDADTFVNVGDSIKEGDTILLVEAMKTFNPITATQNGKIAEILVQDAQPVEFGEPLFIIV